MKKGYKKLIVWGKVDELAFQVYLETKKFPKEERYGLTSQLRRASLSVPTNIAEGMGRQGKNETKYFTNIALGSPAETEYLLEFCLRLKYLNEKTFKSLKEIRSEVGAMLRSFYNYF